MITFLKKEKNVTIIGKQKEEEEEEEGKKYRKLYTYIYIFNNLSV